MRMAPIRVTVRIAARPDRIGMLDGGECRGHMPGPAVALTAVRLSHRSPRDLAGPLSAAERESECDA